MQKIDNPSRMTWSIIMDTYPDVWVGITNVMWEKNGGTIESAVVEFTDKNGGELTEMQINSNGSFMAVYTTPDSVLQLGMVEAM
ncbi:MAG: hypothetical protein FWE14_11970 [Lachnospiraceae bacterium]|nr:hypothetical protein [Lachnospiraceae bacterium]